jgi:hypothetical protein
MPQLRCCEGCSRHVLLSERSCPFCQRELAAPLPRKLPSMPAGLSRRQRLTLAAAIAGQALSACAETTDGNTAPIAGATAAGRGGAGNTAAGHGGAGMSGGAGHDVMIIPPYGLSPPPPPRMDASAPNQDAEAEDAGPARGAGR